MTTTPFLGTLSGDFIEFPSNKILIGYKLTITDGTEYTDNAFNVVSADDLLAIFESSDPISIIRVVNSADTGYSSIDLGTDNSASHACLIVYPSAASSFADNLHLENSYGEVSFWTGPSGTATERLTIDTSGDVGIKTNSPNSYLGELVVSSADAGGITIVNGTTHLGSLNFADGTTGDELYRGSVDYDHDNDTMSFGTAGVTGMDIDASGNVDVVGALSKGSGSFKIDHPLPEKKDTHNLIHSFIEGPKADLIYRGKVQLINGSVSVNIDEVSGMTNGTFVLLCNSVQCFTSNETDWDAVKGSVSGNVLSIECQNTSSSATVSWMVIGERKDDHMLKADWTDEDGKPMIEPLKSKKPLISKGRN